MASGHLTVGDWSPDASGNNAKGDRLYLPDADPDFDVVYAIRPQSAITWRLADYETSQRRWTW
jgi:hypothetical protein